MEIELIPVTVEEKETLSNMYQFFIMILVNILIRT